MFIPSFSAIEVVMYGCLHPCGLKKTCHLVLKTESLVTSHLRGSGFTTLMSLHNGHNPNSHSIPQIALNTYRKKKPFKFVFHWDELNSQQRLLDQQEGEKEYSKPFEKIPV